MWRVAGVVEMSEQVRQHALEEDLLREHRELETLLVQVHEMFHEHRTHRAGGAARLMDALDELREHLGMMFALKETDGCLDDAENGSSTSSENFCALRAEHAALFTDLSRLIDQCDLDVARGRWAQSWRLAEMTFENFCEQFHDHETGEMQRAEQLFYRQESRSGR
jgi:hypothetical protein